jgi:hypothetical protein
MSKEIPRMRPNIAILFAIILSLCASSCGPMFLPMSTRLDPEDQHQIDSMWDNILTPVKRVGHDTLLDTLLVYWLYQIGVDRLHLVSEKYLARGKVVMEADCDRASPDTDQFTITVFDNRGRTLRRERYARHEIEQHAKALWEFDPNSIVKGFQPSAEHSTTPPTTEPMIAATPEQAKLERDRRLKAIEAATRPARISSDH